MNLEFKKGDKAYLGILPGIVLGTYVGSQVLFFSEWEGATFYNSKELLSTGNKIDDISFLFLREYFKIYNLTEESKKTLLQKRFTIVDANKLQRGSTNTSGNSDSSNTTIKKEIAPPTPDLSRRRHLYLNLIKKKIKEDTDAAVIERLFDSMLAVQKQIEENEQKKAEEEAKAEEEKKRKEEMERQAIACAYEEWGCYGLV